MAEPRKPLFLAVAAAGAAIGVVAMALLLAPEDEPAVTQRGPGGGATTLTPRSPLQRGPREGDAPQPWAAAEGEPDLEGAIDDFLSGIKVTLPPPPSKLLEEALASDPPIDPRDYRLALERSLRQYGSKDAAALLVERMEGASPELRFQHALAVAARLDEEGTTVLLEGLGRAPDAVRPDVVFALRGSPEPRVNEAFVDLYDHDLDPEVRARAGFVVGERGERIAPHLLERARQTARQDLRAEDERLVKGAADVLGVPPLDPSDKQALLALVATPGEDPLQRREALRALASGGTPVAELAPILERVAADSTAGDELRAMARTILEAATQQEGQGGD